jgi:hypothetical protein
MLTWAPMFLKLSPYIRTPWRDSISRLIAPIDLAAFVDETTRPRRAFGKAETIFFKEILPDVAEWQSGLHNEKLLCCIYSLWEAAAHS